MIKTPIKRRKSIEFGSWFRGEIVYHGSKGTAVEHKARFTVRKQSEQEEVRPGL